MIYDTLKKRKFVRRYDSTVVIPQSLIDALLRKAWEVTPSKNNFMPYTVHVIGQDQQKYKELVYLNCLGNEGRTDGIDKAALDARYAEYPPNYSNILNCSYLLVFTMRLETSPSWSQQSLINRGHKYEAVDESKLNSLYSVTSFEVGLFADAFGGMCVEHDLDVSCIGCFKKDVETWTDIPFVTRKPIMLMTVGKGEYYLDDERKQSGHEDRDYRPSYERIVNFVK